MFTVDTTTEVFSFPVVGASGSELQGTLTDDVGRRRLELNAGGQSIEVAATDWNLPPGAALDISGAILVCWNRLPGSASDITVDVPDPTQGVELWCRLVDGGVADGAVRVETSGVAAWLTGVKSDASGSWTVTFFQDDGWLVGDPQPGHGTFTVDYTLGSGMGTPTQVSGVWVDPDSGAADTGTGTDSAGCLGGDGGGLCAGGGAAVSGLLVLGSIARRRRPPPRNPA
ncbi:hypothetical protein LBMAG42_51610 [Deltaproteobacteria bacterium]|nr:hypothetical protein LBMAG42_51610 [Deltaproteobacteria bacterium]